MAKRGYKLQEFVAHSANVNCLRIGKKTPRHFITGGDDEKVNLWSVGKPTSLMSLSGHTSPVESVAFDSAEVLVAAGSSAGVIKLWDLEETKVVRTLNAHRSYCTALEFHPFGEFFASGSMDTNLKIWDIRKKGCIHTYKGHTRGVSTIRFTPDGRWVVSGGLDNVVKAWDLTAGKLLHDFKFHEGHIRSIDFHPLEFLLATGSSDRTVKFWDLETFELIGSTRPEATGVRSIRFHPDGRTLFCGLDSSLKVYSWEPVICHDAVDMGWSTLGDLCIDDGKLLGCSYYQNSVGVWVADVSLIEPYGDSLVAEQITHLEPKTDLQGSLERVGSHRRSTSISSDYDTKEIKNIYVDTAGVTPVASRKSIFSPKVASLSESREISNLTTQNESFIVPNVVPRDSTDGKDSANSSRESIGSGRGSTALSLKPPHRLRPSTGKLDLEGLSVPVESVLKSDLDTTTSLKFQKQLSADDAAKDSSEEKVPIIKSVAEKFEKASSPRALPNQENCNESIDLSKEMKSVKYVNGVQHGRTRSLVERFEKREKLNSNESQTPDTAAHITLDTAKTSPILVGQTPDMATHTVLEAKTSPLVVKTPDTVPNIIPEAAKTSPLPVVQTHEVLEAKTSYMLVKAPDTVPKIIPEKAKTSPFPVVQTHAVLEAKTSCMPVKAPDTVPNIIPEKAKISPLPVVQKHAVLEAKRSRMPVKAPDTAPNIIIPGKVKTSPLPVAQTPDTFPKPEKAKTSPMLVVRTPNTSRHAIPGKAKSSPLLDDNPQTTGRGLVSRNDDKIIEDLMLNHDVFLSTLRSRLTKLQVVRHFWERNDIKGAINALRKLPDHSVQADVVSVLMEKMGTLTLDLFSCLLPVLLGLLDSKTERHMNLSLEMLLKLVAVFGPVVHSTISAPPAVGVDLQAEKRLECCNQCFIQLQKIQNTLPTIIRRGGLPAKCALELNLILQQS